MSCGRSSARGPRSDYSRSGLSSDARALFGGILGPEVFTPLAEGPVPAAGAAGRAPAAAALARCCCSDLLFLVALAGHERYAGRLALPDPAAAEGGRVRARLPHLPRELLLVVAGACARRRRRPARSRSGRRRALARHDPGRRRPLHRRRSHDVAGAHGSLAPFDAGERLLDVRDDVAFREMLRAAAR